MFLMQPSAMRRCALLLIFLVALFAPAFSVWAQEEAAEPAGLADRFDAWFGANVVGPLGSVLFFELPVPFTEAVPAEALVPGEDPVPPKRQGIPVIILTLVCGGIFYTFRYGFINIRLFRHSIEVVRGRYDNPDDEGEISHFKALTSALSATVGLGNIAGVAVAISMGGPGAVFWMWLTAVFGMSMKFSSCTLAQLHRRINPDGRVLGGPMIYLQEGIGGLFPRLAVPARGIAIFFAILTIGASIGGGNMFQSNQTASIVASELSKPLGTAPDSIAIRFTLGLIMAGLVGTVLIGGIRRIGELTSRMVPAMCIFYCFICLVIIVRHYGDVPELLASIFTQAFKPDAMFSGGFIGVLVQGMKRAAFSNEAGLGSAAIAHAAAKTNEPVREGVVAMLGPFIDTIVVCTMTALAILITGAHLTGQGLEGIQITQQAFSELHSVASLVLTIAVFVFAYSTLISWGYYGERATEYLFGRKAITSFRVVFIIATVLGPILSLKNVIDFSDLMLLSMAFPNIIGMLLLSGEVKRRADDYVRRLRSGEMKRYQ